MMSRSGIGVGVLVIVAAFFLFYPLYPVLRVASVKKAELLFCARMAEGEEFVLSFIHSVNKRPVFDTLRIEGDHLLIVKSRFDSFGAGMPEGSQIGKMAGWSGSSTVLSQRLRFSWVGWRTTLSVSRDARYLLRIWQSRVRCYLCGLEKASRYGLWKGRCGQ